MAYEVHLSKAAPRTSKSCQQVGGASGVTSGGHGPQSKMTLRSPNPAAAPRHCLPAASRPSHQVPWPPACPQTPPGHLTPGSPAARPHACGRYRFSVPARHRTRRRYLLAASLSAGLGQCLRPSHSAQPSAAYPHPPAPRALPHAVIHCPLCSHSAGSRTPRQIALAQLCPRGARGPPIHLPHAHPHRACLPAPLLKGSDLACSLPWFP